MPSTKRTSFGWAASRASRPRRDGPASLPPWTRSPGRRPAGRCRAASPRRSRQARPGKPSDARPPNDGSLVFHDDQGVQHASKAFQRCLGSHGAARSISRPGTPLDDAVAESFFKTLKRELVKGKGCGTREEARQDIFKRIELHCDTVRMRSSLDYASPMEYERRRA